MPHDTRFWDDMLPALRAGDHDELIRRLRHVLEADPFRITPRHWLAEIHRRAGDSSRALAQYDRLLPLAVGAGDVFRTLAVQKRLDELDPRPGARERLAAIHRWFRLLGPGHLLDVPASYGPGLSARALADLPVDAFVHAATHATLESLERAPRILELRGREQLVVLFGAFAWDLRLQDGRRRREEHAEEGARLALDPELAPTARLRLRPDTPCECLRFDAGLLAELARVRPGLAGGEGTTIGDIVREERALLPHRPRRVEDIDHRVTPPAPPADAAPARLEPVVGVRPAASEAMRDVESWIGHGTLTLDPAPLDLSERAGGPGVDPAGEPPPLDLDPEETRRATTRQARPVVEPPGPVELGDGLVVPPSRDPFAAPVADLGTPIERRDGGRVACEFGGRVRLMGLGDAAAARLECRVFDVSPGGIGVWFERERILHAIAVLEHEVLRVELDLPHGARLNLAARMRWVDLGDPEQVRAGLQFVLLAPGDRATLARLVGAPPPDAAG